MNTWLSIEQLAGRWNCSIRHAKRRLAATPPATGLIKTQPNPAGGRPRLLYHIYILGEGHSAPLGLAKSGEAGPAAPAAAAPVVAARCAASPADSAQVGCAVPPARPAPCAPSDSAPPSPPSAPALLAPDDLALAQLRAGAVLQYEELRRDGHSEAEAVRAVCQDIAARPRVSKIEITERLPGGHERKLVKRLSIAGVAPSTLREWAARYNAAGRSPAALAPSRKGRAGRPRKTIPDTVIKRAYAWSIKNSRGDMVKALQSLEQEYPGDLPAVSAATWRRRVREFDPERYMRTLATRGVSEFRKAHSPDITLDYSQMQYNDLWELDDCTLDFYGYSWNLQRMLRPFAYAVIRVPTRQWICVVTCERPINQEQVRQLVGAAMADPRGGIPRAIRFERGTVACDSYLESLLSSLGVRVERTSMDGGKIHPNACPDRASGHFQGKGVCERAIRELHNIMWDQPTQVGTNERYDSAASLENLKKTMLEAAKAGRPIRKLTPQEWMAAVACALDLYNNRPHGALPEIVDADKSTADSIQYRRMSPNEYAASLNVQEIPALDPALLQSFAQKGVMLTVGKNGFTINSFSYGRFDQDLQALAGKKVLVFAMPECPQLAYVHELRRCVEAWRNRDAAAPGDAFERKRGIEKAKRNKYEELIAEVLASGSNAVLDHMQIIPNPVVTRAAVRRVTNPDLANRLEQQRAGIAAFRDSARRADARFDMPAAPSASARFDMPAQVGRAAPCAPSASTSIPPSRPSRLNPSAPALTTPRRPGGGLLAREGDLAAQLDALGGMALAAPLTAGDNQ